MVTTSTITANDCNPGLTFSSSSIDTAPSCSITLGSTSLETSDIDFIHSLQNCAGSSGDIVQGLRNFMQTCKANWAYIPQEYT